MLKLYKQVGSQIYYWKTWDHDEKTGVIHWGVVGQTGQTKQIKSGLFSNYRKVVEKRINQKLNEGFAEFEENNYAFLEIEYPVDGMGTVEDLYRRHSLEEKINSILGSTGLGYSDGGSIQNGVMQIGCVVVDVDLARKVIEENLKNTEFANYSRIVKAEVR